MSDPAEDTAVRFAVVDDLLGGQLGTKAVIELIPNTHVEATMTFFEAGDRPRWDDVDFVICDVADGDAVENVYPSIEVMRAIRARPSARAVQIIAVTGIPEVFEEDVVRRMLSEAGVDHFVQREFLDEFFQRLIPGGTNPRVALADLPSVGDPASIPELGVTDRTRLGQLVDYLNRPEHRPLLTGKITKKVERDAEALRAGASAAAGELKPVNTEGQPIDKAKPPVRHLREIWRRGTRLPRRSGGDGN